MWRGLHHVKLGGGVVIKTDLEKEVYLFQTDILKSWWEKNILAQFISLRRAPNDMYHPRGLRGKEYIFSNKC